HVPDRARQVAYRQHGDPDLMSLLARRGFTLIELMIALVLLGMVSAAVYKVLVNNQRVYLAQTQTIDLQQNIRAAAAILPAAFRDLVARQEPGHQRHRPAVQRQRPGRPVDGAACRYLAADATAVARQPGAERGDGDHARGSSARVRPVGLRAVPGAGRQLVPGAAQSRRGRHDPTGGWTAHWRERRDGQLLRQCRHRAG